MAATTESVVEDSCPFCKIWKGENAKQQEILYEDSELFVVSDIKPWAIHHYLVIPKEHVGNAKTLGGQHVELINRLVEAGTNVLRQKNDGNADDVRYGFHWPPFHTVEHLHLHVLCPVSQMSFLARNIVFKPGLAFVTPGWLLERIKSFAKNEFERNSSTQEGVNQ